MSKRPLGGRREIRPRNAGRPSIPGRGELADEIIESQVREIAEMKALLDDIDESGERGETPLPARAAAVTPDMMPQIEETVR